MTMNLIATPNRRRVVALCAGLAAWPAQALGAPGRLRFAVYRNGSHVGEQEMTFTEAGAQMTVATHVALVVRLGPVPVFRYSHEASEHWRGPRFEQLETATLSNGKRERVHADANGQGVRIETQAGTWSTPANAAPLSHWNTGAFAMLLFNPQTGRVLKVSVARQPAALLPSGGQGTRWTVRGEAVLDDWYDAGGVWTALRGQLPDRSTLEYRRL